MKKSALLYSAFLLSLTIYICNSESEHKKNDKLEIEKEPEESTIYFYNSTVSGIFNFIK